MIYAYQLGYIGALDPGLADEALDIYITGEHDSLWHNRYWLRACTTASAFRYPTPWL